MTSWVGEDAKAEVKGEGEIEVGGTEAKVKGESSAGRVHQSQRRRMGDGRGGAQLLGALPDQSKKYPSTSRSNTACRTLQRHP